MAINKMQVFLIKGLKDLMMFVIIILYQRTEINMHPFMVPNVSQVANCIWDNLINP